MKALYKLLFTREPLTESECLTSGILLGGIVFTILLTLWEVFFNN